MNCFRHVVCSVLLLTAATAMARPHELDLIGLKMGVSQEADLNTAGKQLMKGFWQLEIGGHQMRCTVKFLEEKLSAIHCPFGAGYSSSSQRSTEASNEQVFKDLKAGYLKKFGTPQTNESEVVENRMGAKFTKYDVRWEDDSGSTLGFSNMTSSVDRGSLLFISKAQSDQMAEERKKKEAQNKF